MIFKAIIYIIPAYLIGSIMSGYWIGKIFYHEDIRDMGSGNIGTTNAFRTLGIKAGIVVMILDIAKGTIATLLPGMLGFHDVNPLIFGLVAVLGHCFSIFMHFHGGKAVATTAGVMLGYNWQFLLVCAVILLLTLLLTSTMSLASITSFVLGTVYSFFIGDLFLSVICVIACAVTIYAHRENIKRIKCGTESKIPFGFPYWSSKKTH
ncbi:MAG: glycerol-3-phosphate 1-O-acyltransferase PlsY [Oenococcus sp.]|uniref:glycerol-3-phosphate 1-O-acyltransferase PlsY n=1 Tax=Oenococcus TaxID=46254 RepID=UPI0021E8ED7C|nr:glycerol-3-phosphate 1-O-acyltransferase PlsY [Oenococcus kitaharae]MCV3295818.1 glycerol-3-phosphate 1-O-acyltransferase PlsY [Oenococcus kitaharae]